MTDLARNEMLRLLAILSKEEKRLESGKLDRYVPHPKQLAFHKSKAKVRLMLGGNRPHSYGTKLMMSNGEEKNIEDINIGDSVLVWDGEKSLPGKVCDIPYDGEEEIVEYITKNGNSIKSTKDHCFPFFNSQRASDSNEYKIGSYEDISKSKWKQKKFLSSGPMTFSYKKESKICGLLMGMYLGDGSSSKSPSSTGYGINFATIEQWKEDLFKKSVKDFDPDLRCEKYKSDSGRIYVRSNHGNKNSFIHELRRLQLLGLHGHKKFIPEDFKRSDIETRKQLLRGLIITDGCTDNHKTSVYSTSRRLVSDIAWVVKSLGGYSEIYLSKKPNNNKQNQMYVVQWSNNFTFRLGIDIGHKKVRESNNKMYRNDLIISEIKNSGVSKVRCITVDHPLHCFILANGIVSKNSGKTTSNLIECVWTALGIHPYNPIPVPNRGKMYGDSFSAVMETFVPKFEEWCPPEYFDPKKPFEHDQRGNVIGVNFKNGSRIIVGSYDQEDRKAEGSRFDYISFDEPPSRELYIANMRGLIDTGGRMWFSLTPISQAWLKDDIFDPGISGEKPYIECFNMRSDENPHIDHDALGLFLSELTDAEKEVRFHGHFAKLTGVVIDTYDAQIHDIDPFELDDSYVIYEGIDPHPMKPHCALWKAVSRDGIRYVVDELAFTGGLYDFGKELVRKRKELCKGGARIGGSVVDTIINTTEMANRIDMRAELVRGIRDAGGGVLPSSAFKRDQLNPGIEKIKDLYRVVDRGPVLGNGPMQYVFRRCVKYKYELTHYQWPETLTDVAKPKPIHDDFISGERYLESINPEYQTPGKSNFLVRNSSVEAYSKIKKERGYNIWQGVR